MADIHDLHVMLDSIDFVEVESTHKVKSLVFRCLVDCDVLFSKVVPFRGEALRSCVAHVYNGVGLSIFVIESTLENTLSAVSVYGSEIQS